MFFPSYNPYAGGYVPSIGQGPGMQVAQISHQGMLPMGQAACPPGQGGLAVIGQPMIPPSQTPRIGDGQVIQNELYDHLLWGVGQTLPASAQAFGGSPGRAGNPMLTNVPANGTLNNDKQAEIVAIYAYTYFNQPQGSLIPQGAPSASFLYDLFAVFTRLEFWQQDSVKSIIPVHRIGPGGGVAGYDVNNGAIVKNQGAPGTLNLYRFDKHCRYFIPPGKDFKMNFIWMTGLPGGTVYANGFFDPNYIFNLATTAIKLFRAGAVILETRDSVNG